ncbi:CoA transferase [Falsiroseomonas oryziterrae]|uniref:CoA transferase n=1 Tax=Falsiroseomonas oryziterrae TaxID=2911368 RepID=UPI001F008B8C|nr:CoA transferase [Roseomonas sp. NPKOSM-4]
MSPEDAPLAGLRLVEVSAFVAAPIGGMTLAQLGAEVIRIDPIGGNIDIGRWPLAPSGTSLYWAGLNKGKRSVCLALDKPEGREIAAALIAEAGILLTNLPSAEGWMSYAALSARRPDLIMLRLTGTHDGGNAIDYTVNAAVGFPVATGEDERPVNHVLPAWDVAAGLYLATGLLAAERRRTRTGRGGEVTLALSDVAYATVATLGYLADVQVNGHVRPPLGNHLYGAFGRDFSCKDGRRVMLAAISNRQWRAIGKATGLAEKLEMIGPLMGVDMSDEGGRYAARDAICAVLAPWFAARSLPEVRAAFEASGVLWGPYQDFGQMVREDPRCSAANPMFAEIEQPGAGRLLAPASPLQPALPPRPAPRLGADTDAVLRERLGLPHDTIAAYRAAGLLPRDS